MNFESVSDDVIRVIQGQLEQANMTVFKVSCAEHVRTRTPVLLETRLRSNNSITQMTSSLTHSKVHLRTQCRNREII